MLTRKQTNSQHILNIPIQLIQLYIMGTSLHRNSAIK